QRLKRGVQAPRQGERLHGAAIGLHGGAQTVGGQFQGRQAPAQSLLPPGQLRAGEFESFPLPNSEVRVLDGRVGQLRWIPGAETFINRRQFPEEKRERAAVENDVVHRQEENMLAGGQSQQFHAQQGQALQIKQQSGFLRRQSPGFGLAAVLRLRLQIDDRQFQRQGWLNDLDRLAVVQVEPGPQDFMAADDLIDGLFQDRGVERTFQTRRDGDVVERAARLKLFQEPESLLPGGNWKSEYFGWANGLHFVAGTRRGVGCRHRCLILQFCFAISAPTLEESGFRRYCSRETRIRPASRCCAGRAVRRSIALSNSATGGFSNRLRM